MWTLRWIVVGLLVTGVATAGEPLSTDKVSGFTAPGVGEISGRVTDASGSPAKNATVHVVTKRGERTITTDGNGRIVELSSLRIGSKLSSWALEMLVVGGQIAVEPNPGGGTIFRFTLRGVEPEDDPDKR